MVDFRYHLVSLIAVFMALAIGIVLGAGPLQNSIGSALNDQVESLRTSRDEARVDAEEADRRSSAYQAGLESLTPELIAGTLDGQSVVLISLPGADENAVEEHRVNLAAAGAEVTGTIALSENFFSADRASYRSALANQLDSYVEPAGSPIATLTAGLELIVTTDATDQSAATLSELYQASDNALIEVKDTLTGPAEAMLIIGPTAEEPPEEGEDTTDRVNTVELVASVEMPMVLASGGGEATLLEAVRSDDRTVSTVDSPDDTTALINVPFALSQELTGSTVAWGIEDSAEMVIGSPAPLELAVTEADTPVEPADENPEGAEPEQADEAP